MATIVNNPGDNGDSSAGWAVAVIILLVVIAGIAFWYMRYRTAPAQQSPGATIQVNLPTGGNTDNGGGSGGGDGAPAPAPAQ